MGVKLLVILCYPLLKNRTFFFRKFGFFFWILGRCFRIGGREKLGRANKSKGMNIGVKLKKESQMRMGMGKKKERKNVKIERRRKMLCFEFEVSLRGPILTVVALNENE